METYNFVGVDISKDTFDVHQCSGHTKFDNTKKGFDRFIGSLVGDSYVVMEASGPYFHKLACHLHQKGIMVSVVNPLVVKRYVQMRMERTKTDKKDAFHIMGYAQMNADGLKAWKPKPLGHETISQSESILARYKSQKVAVKNQLGSYKALSKLSPDIKKRLDKELKWIKEQIKELEQQIEDLIQKAYPELYELACSVPGVGPRSATQLLITCSGFEYFDNYRQVCSYLGLAPKVYNSGKMKGKSPICKMGNKQLRSTLYLAARSAKKYNRSCKNLYDRLRARGKEHKQAMIAVVNKLIKQVFAIVKSKKAYDTMHGLQTR